MDTISDDEINREVQRISGIVMAQFKEFVTTNKTRMKGRSRHNLAINLAGRITADLTGVVLINQGEELKIENTLTTFASIIDCAEANFKVFTNGY